MNSRVLHLNLNDDEGKRSIAFDRKDIRIIHHLSNGLKARAAGAKVNLGYDGVRTRLIALFQKTNCHTQGELIAFAFKHNILLQEGGEIVINPEIDMEGD